MGLGKTMQAMAIMVANPPKSDGVRKCTLIVSSAAIISQWDREIQKHTKPDVFKKVMRFVNTTKPIDEGASTRSAVSLLQEADIVFATYNEVLASYPRCIFPKNVEKWEAKKDWWRKEWEIKRGFLHRVQFYRVILDGIFHLDPGSLMVPS